MNLLKAVNDLFSRPKTVAKDVSAKYQAFALAIAIISDYGAVLEKPETNAGLGPLRSDKNLPHNKETIRQAIAFLQVAIASPTGRADLIKALPPDEAQYVLSETFATGLGSSLVSLDFYVPDTELSEQRRLTKDIAKFMNELGPEERKRLEELKKNSQNHK